MASLKLVMVNAATRQPLLFNSVVGYGVFAGGDAMAQRLENGDMGVWDRRRSLSIGFLGVLQNGILLRLWYRALDRFVTPKTDLRSVAKKIACDEAIFAPQLALTYLASSAFIQEPGDWEGVRANVNDKPFDDGDSNATKWKKTQGWRAAQAEKDLPTVAHDAEVARGLEHGLPAASSVVDRTIPTFSRGELPHFAGINTFMKAPFLDDIRDVGGYDAAVLGVPFDGGTTYRPGTRFGPQGIRRISALYTPYNYETGVDLREQMTMCDAGDVFTIPANIEKTFDQISNAVAYVSASGAMPIIMGGDHSIGFPTVRGIASVTSKNIGIIHVDRHADIQEKDLDERMHTTPYFHATNIPNVPAKNLVQIGIGGWQVPRASLKNMRDRQTNIFTMQDLEDFGMDKVIEMALEAAWDGCDAVYMSYDIDSLDAAFVPGTGWPEPGGLLPREAHKLVGGVAKEGLCGMELVEVSPPYDVSDTTSLQALRIIVETLGSLVSHGKMGAHKDIIDKEFTAF